MISDSERAGHIIARLDRISVWSLPFMFIGIIGIGFLFTFYDIFEVNVSFIQTCSEIINTCSPHNASKYIGLPIQLNLIGYVIGALTLSPIADRTGRRDMLLITMFITGVGSLATAFVDSYTWFNVARFVTGLGIGADLAIVNTYINEMAPSAKRVRYTALLFLFSGIGALLGIWVGLYLTTPATSFPLGLPFAIASKNFSYGWRVMYVIGAFLALIGVLLRFQLPKSPRWLAAHNHLNEAEKVVFNMEEVAKKHESLAPVTESKEVALASLKETALPHSFIFKSPVYLKRTVILLLMWFTGYATVYAYANGFTTILASMNFPPPEAGLIAAFGTIGMVLVSPFIMVFGEYMERQSWIIVASLLTILGSYLIATAGTHFVFSIVGAIILFFGFNIWVPVAYSWTIEQYPTRARTTGFSLVDGIGHLGGGIGIIIIAPFLPKMSVFGGLAMVGGFLLLAGLIAQLGIRSRNKDLDEISP